MTIDSAKVQLLVDLVSRAHPGWTGFDDPRIKKEETAYKHATREKAVGAEGLLRKERLEQLINDNAFATVITDLETIGHDNNLLYQATPSTGDLSILYDKSLDKAEFSRRILDLLYGDGPGEERLGRYVNWVTSQELPNKWTFPTYLLYICFDGEMFIKPQATKWFLRHLDADPDIDPGPSADRYAAVKQAMNEVGQTLAEMGRPPADTIDLQSFLWVSYSEATRSLVSLDLHKRFTQRFARFVEEYAKSPEGLMHAKMYDEVRAAGRENFDAIVAAADRGDDVTDLVLKQLLPHSQSSAHTERSYWIHVAPAINGDIRTWFEASGFTSSDDWPQVAKAILTFLRTCNDDPAALGVACDAFNANPLSKGFQQGMLSPALNALRPDDFLLINNKSRSVLNYFGQKKFGQGLTEYPAVNGFAHHLVTELESDMAKAVGGLDMRPADLFDQFCHWIVAIEKDPLTPVAYWKIAPGKDAWMWPQCEAGNYISIGWDEFGDMTAVSKAEFAEMQAKFLDELGWKKTATQQVWRFAKDIKPGDYIVANRGKSQVIGIGIVTGSYFFVSDAKEHQHRIPVDWLDMGIRNLAMHQGWERTLVSLTREDFKGIQDTAPESGGHGVGNTECPFSSASRDLLRDLAVNPTKTFYNAHKDELKTHVELPVQSVLKAVADHVAQPIREAMETQRRLFSLIPKNDYGRGGAWPFYWGAFYPKSGKKVEGSQLYISLDSEGFTYGFSIGDYGSDERKRLVRNCREHANALVAVLSDTITAADFLLGSENVTAGRQQPVGVEGMDLPEWLGRADTVGPQVHALLPWDDLLGLSLNDLVTRVADAFDRLFPLVILATADNPLSLVQSYLEPDAGPDEPNPLYALEAVASDTGFSLATLHEWVDAIRRKKQAILYGPPGTGKTYIARKLADHIIGGGHGETEIVQFHPAYAYEDFIQGIRPESDGEKVTYPMVEGRFLEFCERVRNLDGYSVLIIDEINRAELSRVFGELMYLLEYRNDFVRLASGRRFSIPSNLRIIGTMNTADRSIALVDNALRRRFAFLDLYPDPGLLDRYHERHETGFDTTGLKAVLERVNKAINDPHFYVGVSFFMDEQLGTNIEAIWRLEIEPYLDEYFFNRKEDMKKFTWDKVAAEIQGATESTP